MEGGDRGVDGRPLAFCRGTYSRWCDGPEEYQGCSCSNRWGASCSWDNSRWCSITSNTREGKLVVPEMIPGGEASKRPFCLYQVTIFLFIPGGVYSHQRPCGGEHFDGRYSPAEWLRRRLRGWWLDRDGWWFSCRAVSPISNTVGGLDRRSRAADSGGAAVSIVNLVSGRAVRGSSGYTIPGLSLAASPASLWGLVIKCLEGSPEKGLVEGCCKAGEERLNSEMLSLEWVAVNAMQWA